MRWFFVFFISTACWATGPCFDSLSERNQIFYTTFDYPYYDSQLGWGWYAHQDLEPILDLVKSSAKIVEIGAGVGRNLIGVLKINPAAKLQAIELNQKHVEILNKKFNQDSRVTIHHANILAAPATIKKQDLAMWMFSGLYDLNQKEQAEAFVQVGKMLKLNGHFVVDIPNREHNPSSMGPAVLHFEGASFPYEIYAPTEQELHAYAKASGFDLVSKKYYELNGDLDRRITQTKFPRISYVFKYVRS